MRVPLVEVSRRQVTDWRGAQRCLQLPFRPFLQHTGKVHGLVKLPGHVCKRIHVVGCEAEQARDISGQHCQSSPMAKAEVRRRASSSNAPRLFTYCCAMAQIRGRSTLGVLRSETMCCSKREMVRSQPVFSCAGLVAGGTTAHKSGRRRIMA